MKREGFRLDELSYRGICMELLRNIWMLLLTALSVWLGVTGVYNLIHQPQYTAQATLVVSEKGNAGSYSSLAMTSEMADVFSQVFQSDALRKKIVEDAGENVEGTITCTPISETNLLVLSVSSLDPRQAYIFINSALKNYEDVAGEVFANAALQIVQEPQVPSSPSDSSRFQKYRFILTGFGVLGMAVLLILLYAFRFTVKNRISAERQLDGTIQGLIPYEKKAKGKSTKEALILASPTVSMNFAEASRRISSRLEYRMQRKHQRVLLVTSISENEGKSTVAANIALAMAEKRKKVLLVDGDFQKPAQYHIFEEEKKEKISLSDVLSEGENWKKACVPNLKCRIVELFQYKGISNPADIVDLASMKQLTKEWKEEFDYVIVDCSPTAVSTNAEIWMQVVDTVLLVVRQDWSDIRVINDTVDLIWESSRDFSGFVLNAFQNEWNSFNQEYRYGRYGKEKHQLKERG